MNRNSKEENIDLGFQNPMIKGNPTVYIGQINISEDDLLTLGGKSSRELFIFGAIVKTGEVHPKYGELKVVEYLVLEKSAGSDDFKEHHLFQNKSVMFKKDTDETEDECADMIKKNDLKYLRTKPCWKISEASVPVKGDDLFYFAKQFYIPENDTTKKHLSWDETIYVFVYIENSDDLIVQIYSQDTSAQTAEDHYKLEVLIAGFDKHIKDCDRIEKLIKEGDKHFHEYVLNHKKTDVEILKILNKYAKTKVLKNAIEKRIK